ncbi:jg27664 [Pararge aegeria aegeria]|uniref:Jg27664 protein n=1 Tax=Pararge aegeria aegeria TaxID=348720 RepID=A0A8S4RR79_9NEOP|nr:jg27664 [Pararge aegeria aegeria]
MSLVEGASDTEHRPDESPKKKTDKPRGSMSEPYMWKEQIHTLMKGADSESDISDSEHFLTKGAFLLTPSHGLSMEKASTICEKMEFKGCFSLTKTATGILFKFSSVDDYQMVFKKGFHKVTGSRFYRKIAIPCRPQKTFTVYVYDIPDDIPEEDVRHALFKFTSIVEVVRLNFAGSPREGNTGTSTPKPIEKTPPRAIANIDGELVSSMVPKEASSIIRITLANIEEANILLQNGLDFYGATYFPTELATPAQAAKLIKPSRVTGGTVSARVRDLLPVFDQQGFAKFAPPASRLVKPPRK